VRKRGTKGHPGAGGGKGGDDALFAKAPGQVKFHTSGGRRFVSIVEG